jgi:uncharacterized protein
MTLEEIDTPVMVAAALQVFLILTGVLLLWRIGFSRKGREVRHQPSPLTPWLISGWDFAYATFIVIAAGVAGQFGAQVLIGSVNFDPAIEIIVTGFGFQGGLLLGAGVAAATMKQRQISAGITQPRPQFRPLNVGLAGVVTVLIALPVLTGINITWTLTLNFFGLDTTRQELVDIFANADGPGVILGMTFLAVVLAPLVEEVVFRGGMFRYLRTRAPDWIAFPLPAAIFAILHGNLVAFGPLFALGIIFAIAYERTGRIAVPIIAHALFNLNTVVLILAGVDF